MEDFNLEYELKSIAELAVQIKENLFKCAHLSVSGNNTSNWQRAESLFNLAKETDALRSKILQAIENNGTTPDQMGSQATKTKKVSRKKPSTAKRKKSEYPKFVVRGDSLYKIGLKRNNKDEYTQNVPKTVYDIVVSRLSLISNSQDEFTADDVIPAIDCPDYQAYIVLAVLRNQGLLEIPRRGSHKFISQSNFELDAATLWDTLKTD